MRLFNPCKKCLVRAACLDGCDELNEHVVTWNYIRNDFISHLLMIIIIADLIGVVIAIWINIHENI